MHSIAYRERTQCRPAQLQPGKRKWDRRPTHHPPWGDTRAQAYMYSPTGISNEKQE
jgi:hypothetical protein